MVKKRVSVYVDGFNLYHAIKELCIEGCKQEHLKWVNLWDLSEKLVGEDEEVTVVKYFSAYAKWLDDNYRRHQVYVKFYRDYQNFVLKYPNNLYYELQL